MPISDTDKALLIRAGRLKFLLHSAQQEIYDQFYAWRAKLVEDSTALRDLNGTWPRTFVTMLSRRFGKDYMGLVLLAEQALKHPNTTYTYVAATRADIQDILTSPQLLPKLTQEFPPDCRLEYKSGYRGMAEGLYAQNGSVIKLQGLDLKVDNRRGRGSSGMVVSEAAFVSDLKHVVESVLLPQFLGTPDAFLILNSTPAEAGASEFDEFCVDAKQRNAFTRKTIWDAPHYTDSQKFEFLGLSPTRVKKYIQEHRLTDEQAKAWLDEGCPLEPGKYLVKERQRREYLCIQVRESSNVVVPEFDPVFHVKEFELPRFFQGFTIADPGVEDLCAVNQVVWDFENARMLVVDEWTQRNANTAEVAQGVRKNEATHFHNTGFWNGSQIQANPAARYSDVDLRMITDLAQLHDLKFQTVKKDDAAAALAGLRVAFQEGQIWIHPRCKNTIDHLLGATWNKSRSSYQRSEKLGHCDHLDVLKYAWRSINKNAVPNPPPGWLTVRERGRGGTMYKESHFHHPNNLRDKIASLLPSAWSTKR